MSWPYGPFTAVSGQIIGGAGGISVPQKAAQIEIENDSRMWLYVAFTNIAPKVVAGNTSLDSSGFSIPIRPYGYKCIPLPETVGDIPFQGIVWIQASDRTSALAQTGTSSNNADVFVTALAKGEQPTLAFTLPRSTDVSSQTRVIALDPVLTAPNFIFFGNTGAIPAAGVSVLLANLGQPLDAASNDIWFVYLYWLDMWPNTNNTNAGGVDFTIQVDLRKADNTSVGFPWPQTLARGQMYWPAGNAPPTPYHLDNKIPRNLAFGSQTANLDHVALLFTTVSVANAATGATFDMGAYIINGSTGTTKGLGAGFSPFPIGGPLSSTGFNTGVVF